MISVTILTKNSARYLPQVLASLSEFNEVLIYDNGSQDETLKIAEKYSNVVIVKGDFVGFGPTHNIASSLAKNDWILSLDSDEVATPEMVREIFKISLEADCVYSFPRNNYYNEKLILWCGWHPDRQIRLYNRSKTHFDNAHVHEAIVSKGMRIVPLRVGFLHYSYSSHSEFLSKMQSYSDLFAKQRAGRVKSSPCKAVLHGFFAFFKAYILKRGIFGGYEGFVISAYNGNTAFYKYLKLHEANKKVNKPDG